MHSALFTLADISRRHFLLPTPICQSKHAERARARPMGVADYYNASSDRRTMLTYNSARCWRQNNVIDICRPM